MSVRSRVVKGMCFDGLKFLFKNLVILAAIFIFFMGSGYLGFVFMLYGRDGTLQFSVDRFIYEFFYAEKFNPEYMDYYKLDDNNSHYFLFVMHGVSMVITFILTVWPTMIVSYTVYIIVRQEYLKRYDEEEEKEYKEDNYEPV